MVDYGVGGRRSVLQSPTSRNSARQSGNHYIHVTLDGAPIRDSPFRLRVGGKDECDPTAIQASGEGLVGCTTGTKGEFTVKTSNAGAGILTIQMDGPSKVTLDAYEVVAKGAGLNKFFPGRPAMFTIDTALAGNNLLMVGIVTTKGPCEEVVVKHQGNGHYICTYRIQDRLKGFVFIKYGDVEIPGSPFSLEF